MGKTLVFIEHANKEIKRSSLELLTATQASGYETVGLVVGADASGVAQKAAAWGLTSVLFCEDPRLTDYNPELYLGFFNEIFRAESPTNVLASSTMLARDLFPRLATRFDAGIASDCTELSLAGGTMSA